MRSVTGQHFLQPNTLAVNDAGMEARRVYFLGAATRSGFIFGRPVCCFAPSPVAVVRSVAGGEFSGKVFEPAAASLLDSHIHAVRGLPIHQERYIQAPA